MRALKNFWESYKGIFITIGMIGFVMVIAKYTVFSSVSSSSHKIKYMIMNDTLHALCVAPEDNIFETGNNLIAVIDGRKIRVNNLWNYSDDRKKSLRYVALLFREDRLFEVLNVRKSFAQKYGGNDAEACINFKH